MAKFNLFKTKEEKRAYAIGRRHQYNKEHPVMNYAIETTRHSFNEDGTYFTKPYSSILPDDRYKTKKDALDALKRAEKREKYQVMRVEEARKAKNVNIYNSSDCSYDTYKIVKSRKRV